VRRARRREEGRALGIVFRAEIPFGIVTHAARYCGPGALAQEANPMQVNMLLSGACALVLALPCVAQGPANSASTKSSASNAMAGLARFTGTVERVDGKEFLLEGPGGTTATYELGKAVRITTASPGRLADLGSGKFVGCTAVKGHDGKLYATECHIFPESMRGTGEGHNPMGPPDTTMTNGNITTMTNGQVQTASGTAAGAVLKVSYPGGAQNIEVSPQTHVTVIMTGDASLLKPGARVMGAFRKLADGTQQVEMLNVAP